MTAGLAVLVDSDGMFIEVISVLPVVSENFVADCQCQCRICAYFDLPMLVGKSRGFVAIGIDMENMATVFSGNLENGSDVRIASKRIDAPKYDGFRMNKIFWIGANFVWPVVRFPSRTASGSANGLI